MQSGRARTDKWVLEYVPSEANIIDPMMGWTGTKDTSAQIRITFDSKEAAIGFAEKNGMAAEVVEPKQRRISTKNYADNFSFNRIC